MNSISVTEQKNIYLFASPEYADTVGFRKWLCGNKPFDFFICDEIHCASEWGNSFRPKFKNIGELRSFIQCPVAAFTATITTQIYEDVRRVLCFGSDLKKIFRKPDRLKHSVYLIMKEN
jgi:superfamily II DNA helicase RecQ